MKHFKDNGIIKVKQIIKSDSILPALALKVKETIKWKNIGEFLMLGRQTKFCQKSINCRK